MSLLPASFVLPVLFFEEIMWQRSIVDHAKDVT